MEARNRFSPFRLALGEDSQSFIVFSVVI